MLHLYLHCERIRNITKKRPGLAQINGIECSRDIWVSAFSGSSLNFLPSVPSAANVTKFGNFKKYLGNKFAYGSSPNRQVTFGPIMKIIMLYKNYCFDYLGNFSKHLDYLTAPTSGHTVWCCSSHPGFFNPENTCIIDSLKVWRWARANVQCFIFSTFWHIFDRTCLSTTLPIKMGVPFLF